MTPRAQGKAGELARPPPAPPPPTASLAPAGGPGVGVEDRGGRGGPGGGEWRGTGIYQALRTGALVRWMALCPRLQGRGFSFPIFVPGAWLVTCSVAQGIYRRLGRLFRRVIRYLLR